MNRSFRERIESQDKNDVMGTLEYVRMESREETSRLFVENLLKESEFSVEKIASLANVKVEFVNDVKEDLKAK
jgi:hypothetical protein